MDNLRRHISYRKKRPIQEPQTGGVTMVQQLRKSITTLVFFAISATAFAQAPSAPLTLRPEPDNNHNSRALVIDAEAGGAVGYVPDWMLDIVRRMTDIDPDYRLSVEVANGPETPAHLRLLCRLEATLPDGWAPPPAPDFD